MRHPEGLPCLLSEGECAQTKRTTEVDYNYQRFDAYVEDGGERKEFAAFPDHLHAGSAAPDAMLARLDDGATERLSNRWRRHAVVVEFGSYT
jgi:hypothetical protein